MGLDPDRLHGAVLSLRQLRDELHSRWSDVGQPWPTRWDVQRWIDHCDEILRQLEDRLVMEDTNLI